MLGNTNTMMLVLRPPTVAAITTPDSKTTEMPTLRAQNNNITGSAAGKVVPQQVMISC